MSRHGIDTSKLKHCAAHGHHAGPMCPRCIENSKQSTNEDHINSELPDSQSEEQKTALDPNGEREAPGSRRPIVCFTLRRVRLLDVDAKWGSVKDLLDGIAYAGLIPGDREDQIILEVRQEKAASRKDEKTIIEIDLSPRGLKVD